TDMSNGGMTAVNELRSFAGELTFDVAKIWYVEEGNAQPVPVPAGANGAAPAPENGGGGQWGWTAETGRAQMDNLCGTNWMKAPNQTPQTSSGLITIGSLASKDAVLTGMYILGVPVA